MEKWLCFFSLSFMMFFSGCTHKVAVVNTPQGKVTVEKGSNQVTVETKEGKVTYGQVKVSEKDLGVPVYPGATQAGGVSAMSSGKEGNNAMVAFTTKDTYDKVIAFYKGQIPPNAKTTEVNMTGNQMTMIQFEKEGKSILLQISRDPKKSETLISIVSGTKK